MHKLVHLFAAFSLFSALCLGAATGVKAEDSESVKRARKLFSQGVAHFDDGKYQLALDAFEEAYRLRPHPAVRVNIANCYDQLGRMSEAVYHFERYLEEAESGSPQRKEVEKALQQLYRKMGELLLTVVPHGSRIVIDNSRPRKSPVQGSIRLAAGKHDIKVSRKGYEPYIQQFEIRKGEQFELSISLDQKDQTTAAVAPAAASPEPPEEPVDDEGESVGVTLGVDATSIEADEGESILGGSKVLISAAMTATFGISALVCAVAAFGAESQYDRIAGAESSASVGTVRRDELTSQRLSVQKQADSLWIATGFLFGGSMFSGVVMTYFILSEKEEKKSQVRLQPVVGQNGAGVTAVGGF